MIKSKVLQLLYGGTTTVEDFHYDQLVAPPLLSFLSPYDIEQLRETATSIKLSGDVNTKYKIIDSIMRSRGFVRLAGGTNRLVYRHLEYTPIVVKVAMDREGIKNNPDEYRTQHYIKPFCAKPFEVSPCGTVGLFERVERITSRYEFASIAEDVYNMITTVLVGKYVLEDFGTKFMYNWGIRRGFGPVLLDFPDIYELDGSKITCFAQLDDGTICGGEIDYDEGFNFLHCTKCGTQYRARELAKEQKPNSGVLTLAGTKGEVKMRVAYTMGDEIVKEVSYKDATEVARKPKEIKYPKKQVTAGNIRQVPVAVGGYVGEKKSDLRKRYDFQQMEEVKPKQGKDRDEVVATGEYVYVDKIYTPTGEKEVWRDADTPAQDDGILDGVITSTVDDEDEKVVHEAKPETEETVTQEEEPFAQESQNPKYFTKSEDETEHTQYTMQQFPSTDGDSNEIETDDKDSQEKEEAVVPPVIQNEKQESDSRCGLFNGTCQECHDKFKFPYEYCCLGECNEHEFCRGCNYGINVNHPDWPNCVDPNHVMEEEDEEEPAPEESEVYSTGDPIDDGTPAIEPTASYSGQAEPPQQEEDHIQEEPVQQQVDTPPEQPRSPRAQNPARNKKSMRYSAEFYNMRK